MIEEIRNSFVLKNNEKKIILSAINEALSINDDVLRITESVFKEFGFEYDKFIKIFSKLSKRHILKIGKVLTRYSEENQPDEVLLNDLNKTLKKL